MINKSHLVLEGVGVALQLVPRLDLALQLRILVGELLRIVDHLLNVLGSQSGEDTITNPIRNKSFKIK